MNWKIKLRAFFVLVFTLILASCGSTPQPVVELNTNLLAKDELKLGFVYVSPSDKATTHIYGAGCLLCYGVASALTSKLDTHLESTITTEELDNIKGLVLSSYQKRSNNISMVELSQPINKLKKFKGELGYAKKDFRPLKESLGIDVLVVLEIHQYGAFRSFSNYIPNGDPQGYLSGLLYAIDLNTNAYLQYLSIDEKIQPSGEWDEPPTFPNVTMAYYQAIENTKHKIKTAI
ncbi:hypothetical protein N7931_06510 [Catenovulum sp. 2E275]|uniref:hypothetical protein n=1 Tax=Catenovulum sp. 2E275 TaxID=2980497 RepID=UPI0021CF4793|nr:hypothetical protein [Catenovulum sp. 2E275]MCU4675283.1 hypothetical protein [Catenovulum sp. 2E275]